MIPKIKQGNSVTLKFTVMENGEQKQMGGAANLSWRIRHAEYGSRRMPDIACQGGNNPYAVVVHATSSCPLGIYYLCLSFTEAGSSRSVDAAAFELVAHSEVCGCLDPQSAVCLLADTSIGPQGIPGPVGPQGPQGEQGPAGSDGKSPYECAVAGGYAGTEEAFYAQLARTPVEEHLAGTSVELDVEPGRIYLCGELRSLRLRSVPDDARLSLVRFTSGAVATELSLPEGLPTAGWRIPQPHASYAIFLQAATALIVRYDP